MELKITFFMCDQHYPTVLSVLPIDFKRCGLDSGFQKEQDSLLSFHNKS